MDGGTIAGTLLIIFIVLKLVGAIAWSWWWVLSPIWIDLALTVILVALIATGVLGAFGIFKRFSRKQEIPGIGSMRWPS